MISQRLKTWLIDEGHCPWSLTDDSLYLRKAAELFFDGVLSQTEYETLNEVDDMSANDLLSRPKVRVKDASEMYSDVRYQTKHTKYGVPVMDPVHGGEVTTMSQSNAAQHGALLKLAAKKAKLPVAMSEHEMALVDEMAQRARWCGEVNGEYSDHITGVKALLDDSTSDGLEIAPIEFDRDIISFPLLSGELFPLVDVRQVARGRRIEGASISTPTVNWGGADATEISLFTTTSMVAELNTSIFTCDGAIEVGLDFLSDAAVNVGSILTQLIGERMAKELDDVIATGNGTTQPEGITVAGGVPTISSDSGIAGPWTIGDLEDLNFGVAKAYRTAANRLTFVSNDVTFARTRALSVDPASPSTDRRPLLMPNVDGLNNYATLGWPHRVNATIANGSMFAICLAKYRLYRRLGLTVKWETGGSYLSRRNLALLTYRMRCGGRLMDANAGAKITDGQA